MITIGIILIVVTIVIFLLAFLHQYFDIDMIKFVSENIMGGVLAFSWIAYIITYVIIEILNT